VKADCVITMRAFHENMLATLFVASGLAAAQRADTLQLQMTRPDVNTDFKSM
jgi:hypothetical protein